MTKTRTRLQVLLAGVAIHAAGVGVLLVLPLFALVLIANEQFYRTRSSRLAEIENGAMAVTTIALTFAVISGEKLGAVVVDCLLLLVFALTSLLLLPSVTLATVAESAE